MLKILWKGLCMKTIWSIKDIKEDKQERKYEYVIALNFENNRVQFSEKEMLSFKFNV